MKNKKRLILAIVVGGIIISVRLTGILGFYNIPSSSNAPNLKVGSKIIGSNLVKPRYLDFAYFKFSDSLDGWTIVKRLIAIPKDTLSCVNGNYFVNGKNIDSSLNLRFQYRIHKDLFENEIKKLDDNLEFYSYAIKDTVIAYLDDSFVKALPIKLNKNYVHKEYSFSTLSDEIFSKNTNWTVNNFGPVVIPKGKYFFSGDNRDNSADSRYRGYVDEENILGTVIFQY